MKMKIDVKNIYDKMVDFHRFATVLLAVGVFFYLGVIIPNVATTTMSQLVGIAGSLTVLLVSILFFVLSKRLRKKLEESDEGQNYLMKK
jgi:membrane protein implicated in regulation of membrane protease activity